MGQIVRCSRMHWKGERGRTVALQAGSPEYSMESAFCHKPNCDGERNSWALDRSLDSQIYVQVVQLDFENVRVAKWAYHQCEVGLLSGSRVASRTKELPVSLEALLVPGLQNVEERSWACCQFETDLCLDSEAG